MQNKRNFIVKVQYLPTCDRDESSESESKQNYYYYTINIRITNDRISQ